MHAGFWDRIFEISEILKKMIKLEFKITKK